MSRPEKVLEPLVSWEPCGVEDAASALAALVREAPQFFAGSILISARSASLPFYRAHRLIELHFTRDHGPERAFVLQSPDDVRWLDGSSATIHDANEI
jgi:hypothetical protein